VREVYRACSKAGVDFVEVGFRGSGKYFDRKKFGLWRFSPDDAVEEVIRGIDGTKISVMGDYGRIDIEDFDEKADTAVDMVRVAAHKDQILDAVRFLEKIKAKGYITSLQAMGFTSYTGREKNKLLRIVRSSGLDYLYIADSYGSFLPNQIKEIFEPFLDLENVRIGFHPHNSLQMAFANALEAIRCGVHIVDSTIYGMGRAAGNLPTEIIISYLEKERRDRYNSIPVLNIIDRYFVSARKETPWGYQLPYMLSGMFQCHPNYAKTLLDQREYTIEDIWKAMDYIKRRNPVGFSEILVKDLIREGCIGSFGDRQKTASSNASAGMSGKRSKVPYANRHKDRDFLILANGPSLEEYKSKIEKFITKYNPVVLGANYLGGLLSPHYHAFNNKRRFTAYVDSVNPESRLLVGQYIPDEMIREYTDRDYERLFYIDEFSDFGIKNGVITSNCRTIAVLLLGVAIVMGAKRIFAAGMDGYMGVSNFHFYQEKDEKEDQGMIIERHHWCQKYIEQIDEYLNNHKKEGVHILTPTSYKSFYKGIDNYL